MKFKFYFGDLSSVALSEEFYSPIYDFRYHPSIDKSEKTDFPITTVDKVWNPVLCNYMPEILYFLHSKFALAFQRGAFLTTLAQ